MNDKSLDNEINLFDLMVRIYIFLRKKMVFIIIITLLGFGFGLLKGFFEKNKNNYQAKIKITSTYLKPSLLNTVVNKVTSNKIAELGFSQVISVNKPEDTSVSDSCIYLSLKLKDSVNSDKIKDRIVYYITNQDTVKRKINLYNSAQKEYLAKLNQKLSEIERYNQQFSGVQTDNKNNLLIKSNPSYQEYFTLLDKKNKMELEGIANPVNCKITIIQDRKPHILLKWIVIGGLLGFILSVIVMVCLTLFKNIQEQASKFDS